MPLTEAPAAVSDLCEKLGSPLFAAIAEPKRVAILRRMLLLGGMGDVTAIADSIDVDRSVVSRHLGILERAGIVAAQKVGRQKFYALVAHNVIAELESLLLTMRSAVSACCPSSPPDPSEPS